MEMFARVWSVTVAGPAIGSVVLGYIAGWGYDSYLPTDDDKISSAGRSVRDEEQDTVALCYGPQCFRLAFVSMIVLNCAASTLLPRFARATLAGKLSV